MNSCNRKKNSVRKNFVCSCRKGDCSKVVNLIQTIPTVLNFPVTNFHGNKASFPPHPTDSRKNRHWIFRSVRADHDILLLQVIWAQWYFTGCSRKGRGKSHARSGWLRWLMPGPAAWRRAAMCPVMPPGAKQAAACSVTGYTEWLVDLFQTQTPLTWGQSVRAARPPNIP